MDTILSEVRLREAGPQDTSSIVEVLLDAFPSRAESELVETLHGNTSPQISLVAELEDEIVGHALFTPVQLLGAQSVLSGLGLAPLAVAQAFQRRGVGTALVAAGLSRCRALGTPIVVVLGAPAFYQRFGFRTAWELGLYYQVQGPRPELMVLELQPGMTPEGGGEVRYHAAFGGL